MTDTFSLTLMVRIQNPAGRARTFTFDHRWRDIASPEPEQEHREN